MKLMLVINNEFSAFHLRGAVKYFSDLGWEVLIMSTPGPLVDDLARTEGGRVVPIELDREINPLADIKSLRQILRILKKEKPDVINVGSPKTGFLFALARILRPSIPMIFTLRGIRSDTMTGPLRSVVFRTEKLACQLAKKVIVISPSLQEHAVSIGMLSAKKAILLGEGSSNGIDVDRFQRTQANLSAGAELRNRLGIDSDAFVIAHVGRVTKDKGIEDIYRAFTDLKQKHEQLHWLVAGPIEESDAVDPSIMKAMQEDDRVHLLGQVDPVEPVYAASNVLVLYSHREGFGNVVLQAAAMEIPTVVADIPGLRDTTVDGFTGRVITPHQPKVLAKAIEEYIEAPELATHQGKSGRTRAVTSFSQRVIWNAQEQLYTEIAKG